MLQTLADALPDAVDGGPVLSALVVLVLGALVALALLLGGQAALRARRRGAQAPEVFAQAPRRSAAEHRRRADEAAAAGDWPEAVAERFRALVRGAEERVLVDERPGRTAGETAVELGGVLPGLVEQLRAGARTFDDVVYGSAPGSADDDARLRALEDQVAAARPAHQDASPAASGAPR
ncbi:DUF4129 domain-containing protein [Pseudokineococcus sp. 1T1Z-3]|uniref:DUF4129 domain-containing protein n=1 Tax=Pseudokineococcus sp. 1T1Z-3 TaxID=3132745 RepID=UPI003096DD66